MAVISQVRAKALNKALNEALDQPAIDKVRKVRRDGDHKPWRSFGWQRQKQSKTLFQKSCAWPAMRTEISITLKY